MGHCLHPQKGRMPHLSEKYQGFLDSAFQSECKKRQGIGRSHSFTIAGVPLGSIAVELVINPDRKAGKAKLTA